MMDKEQSDSQQKRSHHQDTKHNRYFPYRNDTDYVKQRGRPDDGQTDRYFIKSHSRKKEGGISDEKHGIDGQVTESIKPGPPTLKKSPADTKGIFYPLVIPTCDRHK